MNNQKIGAIVFVCLVLVVAFSDRRGLSSSQYVSESFIAEMPVSRQTFRGFAWGERAEDSPVFSSPVEQLGGVNYYVRGDETLQIGDALVNEIHYGFYGGQLKEAYVYFNGRKNLEVLLKNLTARYGEPIQDDPSIKTYFWLLIPTTVMLIYDDESKGGDITYIYEPGMLGGEKGRKNPAISESDSL